MSMFGFSAKMLGFYLLDWHEAFHLAGSLPSDLVPIEDDVHLMYTSVPPNGMRLGCCEDGMPKWVPAPEISKDEAVRSAELEKIVKLELAQKHISLWQIQLQLDLISVLDKHKLVEWVKYITALNSVDTSTAPRISWPIEPEE